MIEGRHPTGPDPWWGEEWSFFWALPDSSLGGFLRLFVFPRQRQCWLWAALVGSGRPYLLCHDDDLEPPANPDVLEVRGQGLWSHAIRETPFRHWTVAIEAFAVSMDDPWDALDGELGVREGLAFDLEWEAISPARPFAADDPEAVGGYQVEAEVHGELQTVDGSWNVSGRGRWQHTWGSTSLVSRPGTFTSMTDGGHAAPVSVPRGGSRHPRTVLHQLRDATWRTDLLNHD